MEEINKFYVYVYLDPRKPGKYNYNGIDFCFMYEPFYVGKGGTKKQYKRHLQESIERTHNLLKFNKIKKIRKETNNDPFIIKIIEDLSENNALFIENILIKTIGRINVKTGCLTNLIDNSIGGRANPSDETRIKLGNATRGKTYEEIHGKEKAKELKQKRIKSNKERERSKETGVKIGNKNAKMWNIVNPKGKKFIIKNLNYFCKKNNLTNTLMWLVANGIQKHHKNWKCFYHNSIAT